MKYRLWGMFWGTGKNASGMDQIYCHCSFSEGGMQIRDPCSFDFDGAFI